MAIEQISEMRDDESLRMELSKMKSELLSFVSKMKSEGLLTSVDYQDIKNVPESEKEVW